MNTHVLLTGLSGAGKSTVGARLAVALGVDFVDLDPEIERAASASIPTIFERDGEAGFREREREALAAALARTRACVLATGGGALVSGQSRALVAGRGTVVWLRVEPAVAARRCAQSEERPLLRTDSDVATHDVDKERREGGQILMRLEALLEQRRHAYAQADVAVDASGDDVDAIVDAITEAIADAEADRAGGRR